MVLGYLGYPGIVQMCPCPSPYPGILSIPGYLEYSRVVQDASMSVHLSWNTWYPGILGISQDGHRCVLVSPLILEQLVSWDTRDIPRWSQMHPCLFPYLGILSILGYSGYPGMFFRDTEDIPGWSQIRPCLSPYPGILSILGYSGYPRIAPDASMSVLLSRDT